MDIETSLEDDIFLMTLRGDFDTTETENFAAEITGAIDAGVAKVLLDISDMEFINSTALGSLLKAQKQLAQYGGGMAAAGAKPGVTKTFRLLELDKKVPLFDSTGDARGHLAGLGPESVSAGGEEVGFNRPDAEEVFGPRPRRGRMEEILEDGLTFSFENVDQLDIEAAFPAGARVDLKFLLPLYHPTHVFKVEAKVLAHETMGRETVMVRVDFVSLRGAEQAAVAQYVKDLRLLSEE